MGMLILEWAGPRSCETRFSWFAIDYPGRLRAIEGVDDAARQLLIAEMLPGQAGKTFPLWGVLGTGTWILSLEKMEIKKVSWGGNLKNQIISVTLEKQSRTSD